MRNAFLRCLALSLLIGAGTALTAGDELIRLEVSSLRLRPEVLVERTAVMLADVLIADEVDPRLLARFGEIVLVDGLTAGDAPSIRHQQVVEALERAGVNMSRVLLGGSMGCSVRFEPPAPPASTPSPIGDAPLVAKQNAAGVDLEFGHRLPAATAVAVRAAASEQTLAERIRAEIAADIAQSGGSPQVEFERGAEPLLDLTSPAFDFDIRLTGGRRLGLREATVMIRRDGRHQRTVRIRCNVRLIKPVIVAARALNVGTFIRAEDLRTEERVFDRADAGGAQDVRGLVGKQLRRFVPVNEVVGPGDVKAADLVKRSLPVTVVGSGGGVSLQLTGVALDSGDLGDNIRVRIGEGRSAQRVLRGVVTGLGTVQIEEGI